MRVNGMVHASVILVAYVVGFSIGRVNTYGQDVGAGVEGGAGIFRAKNPETKKRTAKGTAPAPKSTNRSTARNTRTSSSIEERVEDLLDKGNDNRDARKFSE